MNLCLENTKTKITEVENTTYFMSEVAFKSFSCRVSESIQTISTNILISGLGKFILTFFWAEILDLGLMGRSWKNIYIYFNIFIVTRNGGKPCNFENKKCSIFLKVLLTHSLLSKGVTFSRPSKHVWLKFCFFDSKWSKSFFFVYFELKNKIIFVLSVQTALARSHPLNGATD